MKEFIMMFLSMNRILKIPVEKVIYYLKWR